MKKNTRQYEDDVTLYDLYRILVANKLILFATILVTLLAGVLYISLSVPTYEARLQITPPKLNTLSLSAYDNTYTEFDAKEIFREFEAYLRSIELWREFSSANSNMLGNAAVGERGDKAIDHPIRFSQDKNFPIENIRLSYQSDSAAGSSKVLGRYLEFVKDKFVANTISQVKDEIERQRSNLIDDIDKRRHKARLGREYEIARLTQDLRLAEKLGISDNLLARCSSRTGAGGNITIIATDTANLGYLRGSRALSAELEMLMNRKSDDPFITGLQDLEVKLASLDNLKINTSRFIPYSQDGQVVVPERPIKPRKSLVLFASLFAGAVLGLILAFLAHAFRRGSVHGAT